MTQFQGLPNEVALERCFAGTETVAGTAATPTFKLYGEMVLNKRRPLADRPEYTGDFLPNRNAVWGPVTIEGTYDQPLAYEDLAILPRYNTSIAPSASDDGESTHGYSYTYDLVAARLSLDTATVEHGYPGFPFRATMVHFPEYTISADVDDTEAAWKWSSIVMAQDDVPLAAVTGTATGGSTSTVVKAAAGWTVNAYAGSYVRMTSGSASGNIREIASNDATTLTIVGLFGAAVANTDTFEIGGVFTASPADRTREIIEAPGTKIYLDTGTIGTTEITGRFISFSVTHDANLTGKRFMDDVAKMSTRLGKGRPNVSGQFRLEFDRRSEYDYWTNQTALKLRIQQVGTTINSNATLPKRTARIDVPVVQITEVTKDSRENNRTATFAFVGLTDTSTSKALTVLAKNTLSVLP